ncbi:MAG: xanthine dehydrogenase family protein molybdopterin-binding subunit [Rhizobiaceae bacterium]|nr:xanthine dehydrogenase family protein molybdopterin-binding subunit [Rhizobiaceae bacterium]
MNEILPQMKFGIGASALRKEDDAFVTGSGCYTDDVTGEGVLAGYVLRSFHAHATFRINDVAAARDMPGVHAILTAPDIPEVKPLPCLAPVKQADGSSVPGRDIPVLCTDRVRHVGDAIAFIVAGSLALARDAAEMIDIDFQSLPAASNTADALNDDAPAVYDDGSRNLAFIQEMGDFERTEKAFANADRITEIRIVNNRLVSNYMEPRSCFAFWDEETGKFDVTLGSQGVHRMRDWLASTLGVEPDQVRVRTPDVGGGFGTKVFNYREYALCMVASRLTGKPVKWTGDRTEHFMSDAHGRDNVVTARMAMDKDGKFLAIDVDMIAAMGAYLHGFGPYIPYLGATMTTGLYDIPTMAVRIRGAYTNTVPVDAYRGAGRPEASYLVERLVDRCARDTGLGADEIRRRNFVSPEQLPYTTPGGRMYDTGEFAAHMEDCMKRAGWVQFSERAEQARQSGKVRGIGIATYIEACAFAGSEPAYVSLKPDGDIELRIGTQSNGQGHATAYAQMAADQLGIEYTRIDVRQGDTEELSRGGGTGGSRSIPLGGVSVVKASEALAEKLRKIAADELEASAADIELADGQARIVGTDRVISFADIARSAGDPEDLKADGEFRQKEATYPNGTHVCEVEIDPLTGKTEIVKYTITDDFGVSVNPLLLEGQVHGGVAQGIGQCLNEHTVYDEDGQLLTASFMDYGMPRADNVPGFDFATRNVPSTTNELGIKGAGEAGTIGACPAVMNAVCDALYREYGIEHADMPATPSIVWELINK